MQKQSDNTQPVLAGKEKYFEAKKLTINVAKELNTSNSILKNIQENVLPIIEKGEKEKPEYKNAVEQLSKVVAKLGVDFELDTQTALASSVDSNYSTMAVELCRQLIGEFSCETPSEKALSEIIANSFARYLKVSELVSQTHFDEWLSGPKNNRASLLSKELDRAGRVFLTALSVLQRKKNPEPELNIKTITAFVSQNQQINAYVNKPEGSEINDSK